MHTVSQQYHISALALPTSDGNQCCYFPFSVLSSKSNKFIELKHQYSQHTPELLPGHLLWENN